MQQEFKPMFEKYYLNKFASQIEVEWIDQGGASQDLKYILARYQNNPKSCGIDILWGAVRSSSH